MVLIPEQEDPTLAAMKQAVKNQPQQDRDYLGASAIGHECARNVWYSYNRTQPPSDYVMDQEDGYTSEDITAQRLRMVDGVDLWTEKENGEQFSFEDGKFKGHIDGVIVGLLQAPKAPHVWEHKCTKNFKDFLKVKKKYREKRVLQKWNYQYYIQAQIYMHYMKLDRHYLTVCSAGSRDIASCRTNYNADVAAQYIDRAKRAIEAKVEPPRAFNSKTFFKCRLCSFAEECWKDENA